ncbi:Uncharacterised protein [Salmonella enterica subsp. enterica serovar Bovismorbificans]|uniref:Uncharacterized protein n=1 Tax=Salmonella enterica subsp. enterica serovar Bovismorbificans TaxID=58097 RepID=A0A655BVX6_SALET|nr:Uncharacterised protein [Salmonella enterica subsp. enterica serovar Bovismorbificans]CPR44080.1 Uncharacterised protein [Salmonella enterica subsp. enterica serovar Bovismorbificans]
MVNAGDGFQQVRTLLKVRFDIVDSIARTGDFVAGGIHIDHETRRRDANQHQHDQANAFLTIVRAMRKRHADS